MAEDSYPWTRRDNESTPAYAAFQVYLRGGARRSITEAAAEVGKAVSLLAGWSSKFGWVERVQAYDSHIMNAEVDGYADQVSSVRSRHMEVTEQLLDHLMINLKMWKPGQDPSIRWTQALTAMAKVEQNALLMGKDSDQTSEKVSRVEEMLQELDDRIQGRAS